MMNIQKPDASHALTQAFDRTKKLLFEHFDWKVWFIFGVVSLFASCGRGSGTVNTNFNMNFGGSPGPVPGGGPNVTNPFQSMDVGLIIGFAFLLILVIGVVYAIIVFLGSKAEFSMFHKIATGDHESPLIFMEQYNKRAISVAIARYILNMPINLIMIGFGAYVFFLLVKNGPEYFANFGIAAYLFAALAGIVFAIAVALIRFFINNFVTPVMFAKDQLFMESFKEGFQLFKSDIGQSFLFMAIRFGFSIIAAFAMPIILIMTCCVIIGCIPILNTLFLYTITAPFWVMMTAYSMYFIESYGAQYQMIKENMDYPNYPGIAGANPSPYGDGGSGGGAYAQIPPAMTPADRGITVQPTMDDYQAPPPPSDTEQQQQPVEQDNQQPPYDYPAEESTAPPPAPPPLPTEYKPQYSSPPPLPTEYEVDTKDDDSDEQQPPYPPPPPPPIN